MAGDLTIGSVLQKRLLKKIEALCERFQRAILHFNLFACLSVPLEHKKKRETSAFPWFGEMPSKFC